MRKIDLIDRVHPRGILEILRYNSDKSKLLYPPYVDKNVIVDTGRQCLRGLFGSSLVWNNLPAVGTAWGSQQPASEADIRVTKMKLGMSPIAASPVDEYLVNPLGTNDVLDSPADVGGLGVYVGDGIAGGTVAFAGGTLTALPVRRTLVVNTWVEIAILGSTYITATDDGSGNIVGQKSVYDGAAWQTITVTGTIVYATGAIDLTYSDPPAVGINIDAFYTTSFIDVDAAFGGGAGPYGNTYANVPVSRNTLSIEASGTATGIVYENGDGSITGTFIIAGPTTVTVTGTVNYTTGVWALNFAPALPAGVTFTAHYQVDWSQDVTITFPSTYSVRFESELAPGTFDGYALSEEGLFTDTTLDLMIARKAFPPFRKGVGETTIFRHTIIL